MENRGFDIKTAAARMFEHHPARYKSREKDAFLTEVRGLFADMGYDKKDVRLFSHRGMISGRNLLVGDPDAEYIITAHYDTPGRNGFLLRPASVIGQTGANIAMLLLPVLYLVAINVGYELLPFPLGAAMYLLLTVVFLGLMMVPMFVKNKVNRNDNTSGVLGVLSCAAMAAKDEALRGKCCFVLFDNEEWGLVGSAQYAAWLKKEGIDLDGKLLINLDCIGVGEELVSARTGKRGAKLEAFLGRLRDGGTAITEKRSVLVYMSDHANFRNSTMLSYMSKSSLGPLYIPNIHSGRDTECDTDKVEQLADKIMQAIG